MERDFGMIKVARGRWVWKRGHDSKAASGACAFSAIRWLPESV